VHIKSLHIIIIIIIIREGRSISVNLAEILGDEWRAPKVGRCRVG